MELIFCAKYPFTESAKRFVREKNIQLNYELIERAKKRVISALINKKIPDFLRGYETEEVAVYGVARLIISYIGTKFFINRYVVAEARRVAQYLRSEETDKNILEVGKELGMDIEADYSISVGNYLKFAPHSVDYKLVNKKLKEGRVFLSRAELIRVVEEAVRVRMETRLPIPSHLIPDEIKSVADEIKKELPKPKVEAVYVSEKKFPPCIKKLLSELKLSENLPHTARWVLAVFLLNIKMGKNEILQIFSSLPDFDEKVTLYQIEHTQKKGYKMPSCSLMNFYGLCVQDCGIKNPLAYKSNSHLKFNIP